MKCSAVALILTLAAAALGAEPEPLRPRLHFTARQGWINDPNGLFQLDGVWHLQYQHLWPRHWGHATSKDLIHWEHQPISLAPNADGDCWSGCVVLDRSNSSQLFAGPAGGPVAIYTAWSNALGQRIALAFSPDRGTIWQRPDINPVLRGITKEFRDPKVFWHQPTERWIMLLTEATHLTFFTSKDLRQWTEVSRFQAKREADDDALECPDLFPLSCEGDRDTKGPTTKWVLLHSVVSQRMWGAKPQFGRCAQRYYVGDFDGRSFKPDGQAKPLGGGPDDYASITWPAQPESDSRTVMIGWMNHWGYASKLQTGAWQGCLTFPRELSLGKLAGGGHELVQRPARELATFPQERRQWPAVKLDPDRPMAVDNCRCELLRLAIRPAENAVVSFKLFGKDESGVLVGYDASRGVVFVDRSHCGGDSPDPNFAGRYEASLPLPESGRIELEVLFDNSTIELFVPGAAANLSAVVLPADTADGISLNSQGASTALEKLELLEFRP
jgi:fructan beta-fructosidase